MRKKISMLFLVLLAVPCIALAQMNVSGTVTDDMGTPLPGATIILKGTTNGVTTDFDGNYTIQANEGDVLVFSYIGLKNKEVTVATEVINVSLESDVALLDEVVIIGYGTTTKKDATGAVQLLTSEDLNKGAITTADQMITGKSAGVRVVNNGGDPDAGINIRIRGGSSLNANNSPLIVIDGVPLSNQNPAGQANPLTLINPNDIESFSVLKDASSTAIYGSRASNGVIIITTKSGTKGAPQFNFSSNVQVGTLSNQIDIFDSAEYVDFIQNTYPDSAGLLGLNGTIYDTNWQEEIYRTSYTVNNNLTARANLFNKIPIRASFGHSEIAGILKESQLDRYTASLNIAPEFFDQHLKVTINAKGIATEKDQPDGGAIGSALAANPTLPIYDPQGGIFGGYFQLTDDQGIVGPANPLALLKQRERNEDADRFIGSAEFRYKIHGFEELTAVVNAGIDYSESTINEYFLPSAVGAYTVFDGLEIFNNFSPSYRENQIKRDHLLDAYLSYAKDFEGALNRLDVQAGYAYQNFVVDGAPFSTVTNNGFRERVNENRYYTELNLQSFFARANLTLYENFLLTASIRADASSLFNENDRWGYFPAAALAWKLDEEKFFEETDWIDQLKLRLGWGLTGQQDVTNIVGYYPSTASYGIGNETVQYNFNGQSIPGYRANPYNPNLTWESTSTYNLGIDFNLFSNVLSGNIDGYIRNTTNLLANVPQSEGALSNEFVENVGETESKGFETALQFRPIQTDDFTLEFNANAGFNETYITTLGNITQYGNGGGIGRGTGVNIGQTAVGERNRTFWLYEQVYDADGKAIEDAFVDQNGDGIISDADRRFIPFEPKWTYGFGTFIQYKNLDFTANLRGQIGGNVYNANLLNRGFAQAAIPQTDSGFINNTLDLYDGVQYNGFPEIPSDTQALSDFYLSDASFLRLDNITIGYNLKPFEDKKLSLRFYGSANNVFVITDYDGLDPENFNGIESSPYARPRTYTLGVNVDF
ncbi:SusC/RagA family TonB-linked outer membrane protein [Flavobacterium sp. ASW18X]|uniref:SusC/RagA family TonB-linked outer membrane protein n=1 Tax=Flavobacterium sp. ASW18X TaxID=2572595 RepID=UPI0010AE5D31|nr:SusC/RagA family TonB-linked outer membrane protein [Flavobacterium sp. ASW18X]TKD62501.1 SusC/RagA family TonB-linked outer membrane protein [Flavobacterium sp. ASW18X]